MSVYVVANNKKQSFCSALYFANKVKAAS